MEILAKLSPTANTLKSQIQHEQELARERQKEKKQKGRLQSNNNTTVILLPDFDGGVGAQPTRKNETHDGDKVGKARDVATDSSTAGVDGEGSYDWNGADAGSGGDCGGSDFFGDVGGCFGDGGG